MFCLQSNRQNEEHHRSQFQLRQNRGVGNEHRGDATTRCIQRAIQRHQKEMAELTCDDAGEIQNEELALAQDRFHVASEQIKQEHVA